MMNGDDLARVQRLWRELTTAGQGFFDNALVYKTTDTHRAAPEGWVAIVRIGWQVVVAGPDYDLTRIDNNTRHSHPTQLVDADHLAEFVCPRHTLGPARLYYGTPTGVAPSTTTLGPLPVDDERVQAVLSDATDEERAECGLDDTTSGVFVALASDGSPAAAVAWTQWPQEVAHIGVLCAASQRGTGAAFAAAHAALTAADSAGLLPQWRARDGNVASIALAERLGLSHVGDQYSIRLD